MPLSQPPTLTVCILFSGRTNSSVEALRLPSLAPPLVSERDGILKAGLRNAEMISVEPGSQRLLSTQSGQFQKRIDGLSWEVDDLWMCFSLKV